MAIVGLPDQAVLVIGVILILVGLGLAFFGRVVWGALMSLIGAFIGGTIGYVIGYILGGWIVAMVLSLICAIVGSMLFGAMVKLGLAFLTGILAGGLVFVALGDMPLDSKIIGAFVVLVIVFAISYYFIEEVIGIITALIGGILLGIGIWLVLGSASLGLLIGGLAFICGALVQTFAIRKYDRYGRPR
ncbi:MAG: hypothetical protein ACE5IJ_00485 [Thermoplasmata archaeon]